MEKIRRVEDLRGMEVSGVAFVCDYVEFYFGGPFPILRSLSDPWVTSEGTEYRFPGPGSRDALCRVIGSAVRTVELEENDTLELTMSNDCKITIPLDPLSLHGGEAMHFVSEYNGPIEVW
jgi:hypothetical protein